MSIAQHNATGMASPSSALLHPAWVVPARRTFVARFLNAFVCCTWYLWPSAFRSPSVAKLRAFAGFPKLLDPFEDRDAFDLMYERQCALAREGGSGNHQLSQLGVFMVAIAILVNIRTRKEMASAPPPPPGPPRTRVFIGGPFRTGTTLLQRLLSVNAACKSFSLREFRNPIAPGRTPIQGLLSIIRLLAPHLLSIHPMAIDEPEECIFLLHMSVPLTGLFTVVAPVCEWHQELLPHMPTAYACYSERLERVAALYASPAQTHLILKCPCHGYFIDALHASGSGTREQQRHGERYCMLRTYRRDLVSVAGSLASLMRAMHDAVCVCVDLAAIEEVAVQSVVMQLGQLRRTNELAKQDPRMLVIDVDFDDLVTRPSPTIEAVCGLLGLPFDTQSTAAILAQAEKSRKQKDRYASYHGWKLQERSIAMLRQCEKEMATLYDPIKVVRA